LALTICSFLLVFTPHPCTCLLCQRCHRTLSQYSRTPLNTAVSYIFYRTDMQIAQFSGAKLRTFRPTYSSSVLQRAMDFSQRTGQTNDNVECKPVISTFLALLLQSSKQIIGRRLRYTATASLHSLSKSSCTITQKQSRPYDWLGTRPWRSVVEWKQGSMCSQHKMEMSDQLDAWPLYPREKVLGTHWSESCVGSSDGHEAVELASASRSCSHCDITTPRSTGFHVLSVLTQNRDEW
jgi:hypothetical protein